MWVGKAPLAHPQQLPHLSHDQTESRLRQSAFSRMVLATASALSMVLTAAQVNDSMRAESSCFCKRSITCQLQAIMLSCTVSHE